MNFLAPWFLLGALAIAGPILFHLIRRAARERMPFSSVMFLRPTPPRITRRRRIEHWALLLLRCLALLLLAIGFARPFLSRSIATPASTSEARQLVVLLDTSASMRRDDLWTRALAAAGQYLRRAAPRDQVAIMTFDRQPRTLVSFTEWSGWSVDQRAAHAADRLAAIQPGWMGTQLGLALITAAEHFLTEAADGSPAARRELVLITDLQEGAKLDGLQGHDWPNGVEVKLERIDARRRLNAGLEVLKESARRQTEPEGVTVRVANSRDSNEEKFRIGWNQPGAEAIDIYLPPGHVRSFRAPALPTNATVAELRLSGDQEEFDNRSWHIAPEIEQIGIACFSLDSANDPEKLRYYLQRAFPNQPRRRVQLIRPATNNAFSRELLDSCSLAIATEKLNAEEAAALRNWIASGKTALIVLTGVEMSSTLAALLNEPSVQLSEASGNYSLLGEIDFTHPLFAPFADPRYSDFTQIHFWKHRRWELPSGTSARVLARFDDRSPALVEQTVGQGTLLVLASGWNPADSQLALSSKFAPLMQILLDWSGGGAPARVQFQTGDAIPSPHGRLSAGTAVPAADRNAGSSRPPPVRWQKPDQSTKELPAETPFLETDEPGVYTAMLGETEKRFAVNLPLDESRTAPLSLDDLARLGVPLQFNPEVSAAQIEMRERQLQKAELEGRQKLWRWLIAGVLAITLVEIVLAGRLARRITPASANP